VTAASDSPAGRRFGSLGPLAALSFGVSLAAFVVAVGDARGRSNLAGAAPLFWIGSTLVLVFGGAFALKRGRVTRVEGIGASFIIAVATYAIKEFYSPIQFTFDDEFQHYVTARNIMASHHLFTSNPLLAIGPDYPGMEILTTAISFISGLSIQASSIPLLASAHVLTTVGIYLLVVELVPNRRAALFGVIAYATTPNFLFFDSYFAYQSVGVPLFVITLLALVRLTKSRFTSSQRAWLAITLSGAAATAVVHHVSSAILIASLACVCIVVMAKSPRWRNGWTMPLVIGITCIVVEVWDFGVAGGTYTYLRTAISSRFKSGGPPVRNLHRGLAPVNLTGSHFLRGKSISPTNPPFDRIMLIVWALLLVVLVLGGVWICWRGRERIRPVLVGLAIPAASVLVGFVLVAVSPVAGGQLESRLVAFSMVPGAVMVALFMTRLLGGRLGDWRQVDHRFRNRVVALCGTSLLVVGGIAGGWPIYYARVPGPYVLGGRDRAVTRVGVAVADWAKSNLPPGLPVATDGETARLLVAYGDQALLEGGLAADLFVSTTLTPSLQDEISETGLTLVVVDQRIVQSVPVDGRPIFYTDPFGGHYIEPLPRANIDKFAAIPGVSKIYDDGTIVIYDLHGSKAFGTP
jgi:hypothetical protein